MKKQVVLLVKREVKVDEREIDRATKRMTWLVGFMTVRYPFIYQVLGLTRLACTPGFGTMGVRVLGSGQFELCFDPQFVNSLKDEELTYILYHEVMHLSLHHCTLRQFENHLLGNLAHDLAVNELIPITAGSCEPPQIGGKTAGCFVSELKKEYKDIKEKQTAEYYYDFLREKAKNQKPANGKGNPNGGGDQSEKDREKAKSQKSANGKENPNGGDAQSGMDEGRFDNHGGWKEDDIGDEKVRVKINEIAKSESWGDVGASEKEIILSAQVKRINWRNLLRQFYGNVAWHEHESTRKRPNRRLDIIFPGKRTLHIDRHLVAVDTSGSIDSELLSQFLAIINQMTDYVPIDLMQIDCEVTEEPRPFDRRRKEFSFKGRGGTDFQPIMDVADKRHYRSVVILTDGEAGKPTQPKSAKVVWVLPLGKNPPVNWGKRIHMQRGV